MPQAGSQLGVPELLGALRWGLAVFVYSGWVGLGLQQHIDHHGTAIVRGEVQRRVFSVVRDIWVGLSLQQLGCNCVLAFSRSVVQRGPTGVTHSFEFGLNIKNSNITNKHNRSMGARRGQF